MRHEKQMENSFREKWKRKIESRKKFRESSYKKENDVYKVYWKIKEVGEYIGPRSQNYSNLSMEYNLIQQI